MSLSLFQQLLTGDVVTGKCLLSLVGFGNFLSLTIRPPPKKGVIFFAAFSLWQDVGVLSTWPAPKFPIPLLIFLMLAFHTSHHLTTSFSFLFLFLP